MGRTLVRFVLGAALVGMTATVTMAQTTTQTKKFEVIAVDGNDLVVKLPEGTKEMTVPEDFRFNVDGKLLSVHDLKPGMSGTATVTTRTTMVPVTVTEVKNGTVMKDWAAPASSFAPTRTSSRCSRRPTSTSAASGSCATASRRRSRTSARATSCRRPSSRRCRPRS